MNTVTKPTFDAYATEHGSWIVRVGTNGYELGPTADCPNGLSMYLGDWGTLRHSVDGHVPVCPTTLPHGTRRIIARLLREVRDDWRMNNFESELAGAIEDDHPNCDESHCGVSMALENGFTFSSAHLLIGATECPNVGKVLDKFGGLPKGNDGWPIDWDDWTEWYREHTWKCEGCNAHNHEDADACGNCLAERPNDPDEDDDPDPDTCDHEPAPRVVPPLGNPLPTCAKCGMVYMPDEDDDTDEDTDDYTPPEGWGNYVVELRHDDGTVRIRTWASSSDAARDKVLTAERAPLAAVVSVKRDD